MGSGEIILTASLGAAVGFAMLWWVLFSCWSKSIVQAEVARYIVLSGDTYLRMLNRVITKIYDDALRPVGSLQGAGTGSDNAVFPNRIGHCRSFRPANTGPSSPLRST